MGVELKGLLASREQCGEKVGVWVGGGVCSSELANELGALSVLVTGKFSFLAGLPYEG